jgi:O-antigen ligase
MPIFVKNTAVLLVLFCISLLVSMAGMEIFSWSLTALFLIGLFKNENDFQELKQPIFLILFGLVAWAALSLFMNRAFIADPWRSLGELRWVFSILAITFGTYRSFREDLADKLLVVLTFIATLVSLYSISQYWLGQDWLRGASSPLLIVEETRNSGTLRYRPYGLFKMTLTYACAYAMFAVYPFNFSFRYIRDSKWKFWLYQICSWIILTSVFLTFSRGVWLAMIPVFAGALFILNRRFLVIAAAFCIVAVIGAVSISPALQARMASFTDMKHQSNSDRMIVWSANWEMFKDNPIFGVGYQKNGPPRVLDYYEKMGISKDAFASHAHDVYLNFLSGTGLPGLLLYLSFTLGVFFIGCRNVRRLSGNGSFLFYFALSALAAQAIFMLGGVTEYNFGDSEVRYQFLTHLAFQLFIQRKIS